MTQIFIPEHFFFTATHIGTVCIFHEHSNTEDCYRKALNTVQMAESRHSHGIQNYRKKWKHFYLKFYLSLHYLTTLHTFEDIQQNNIGSGRNILLKSFSKELSFLLSLDTKFIILRYSFRFHTSVSTLNAKLVQYWQYFAIFQFLQSFNTLSSITFMGLLQNFNTLIMRKNMHIVNFSLNPLKEQSMTFH